MSADHNTLGPHPVGPNDDSDTQDNRGIGGPDAIAFALDAIEPETLPNDDQYWPEVRRRIEAWRQDLDGWRTGDIQQELDGWEDR